MEATATEAPAVPAPTDAAGEPVCTLACSGGMCKIGPVCIASCVAGCGPVCIASCVAGCGAAGGGGTYLSGPFVEMRNEGVPTYLDPLDG